MCCLHMVETKLQDNILPLHMLFVSFLLLKNLLHINEIVFRPGKEIVL